MLELLLLTAVRTAPLPDEGCPTAFAAEVLLQAPTHLGGCAVGELDPARPGLEIAAVAGDGSVWVVAPGAEGAPAEVVFHAAGELIQCAVGPARAGGSAWIAAVGVAQGAEDDGGPGAAYVLERKDGGWRATLALEAAALVHGASVGADEVLVTGFDRTVWRLVPEGDGFRSEAIARLSGPGKNVVHTDGGAVVACADGALVRLERPAVEGGAWKASEIDRRPAGFARLAARGELVLACADDGTLWLYGPKAPRRLYGERAKLRGAVLAELDPSSPGPEAATTGYGGAITLVRDLDDAPRATRLFRDVEGLHHLACGDVDGDGTPELVACGYAGRLVLLDPLPR